ncbi:MAG: tRNA epoxyqueuosine(34) reductase QueG [Bacteroidales bacterium]|jgi:epoxyqueuosine reductase|nr:tRNA epoxyqueuosine(34) reductase QueG [Bacteroidales bacterium]
MSTVENNLSALIKTKAHELDFDICGIAKTRQMRERAELLRKWCEAGMNDRMRYLERNLDKRADPEVLFPGVRSLVIVGFSYYSELKQKDTGAPLLSRYAYGVNYHDVISGRLEQLLEIIKAEVPGCEGKIFVDSGQMMEKAWAQEAGLGWQGKHSIVINREIGSFFFIGVLMLNIDLEYDKPLSKDYCGECRLCIEGCPTGAINENRTIDARKCIANLTIENRGPIPEKIIPKLGGRVYGCDKCQEVCPWNKSAKPNKHPEFVINKKVAEMTCEDWESLSEDQYNILFRNSALERVKFIELKHKISAAIRSMDI